jgi:hypothetical protein
LRNGAAACIIIADISREGGIVVHHQKDAMPVMLNNLSRDEKSGEDQKGGRSLGMDEHVDMR